MSAPERIVEAVFAVIGAMCVVTWLTFAVTGLLHGRKRWAK